jgi:phosphate transport system ATP-binding protein
MTSESDMPALASRTAENEPRPTLRTTLSSAAPTAEASDVPEIKLSIQDLHFYYKKYEALKGITLPIYAKRVTAFIGPSG